MKRRETKHFNIRKTVKGSTQRPRLAVFRSNIHIYAQIIDDSKSVTLVSASDAKLTEKLTKSDRAYTVGKNIAEAAIKKGIKQVVFDRGGFLYHGRIARLATGAREGGLEF